MKVGVFSSKRYDESFLLAQKADDIEFVFLESRLTKETVSLAAPFDALCLFVNDVADAGILNTVKGFGIDHIALRCAGFNNLDLKAAKSLGISVSRVPAYSPEAVAEHTIALILTLNRRLHKAYNRVKENNFSLKGLLGFNLHHKHVGVIGTGKIGKAVVSILKGFGCQVLCYDPYPDTSIEDHQVIYVTLDELLTQSQVITLHCPLTADNHYLINAEAIAKMRNGVMLINTSRGALIETQAVIDGLKSGKIGNLGLDVYEMESELFFEDLSDKIIQDDVFERLASFPNVLITGHQGFFTQEALEQIASTTVQNLRLFSQGKSDSTTFLVDQ